MSALEAISKHGDNLLKELKVTKQKLKNNNKELQEITQETENLRVELKMAQRNIERLDETVKKLKYKSAREAKKDHKIHQLSLQPCEECAHLKEIA